MAVYAVNKSTPAVDGLLNLYFGTNANASTTAFKLSYDFEFFWE